MSRTCPDCEGLQDATRSPQTLGDPHEYLVPQGRSKADGEVFYRCLLCNTFLTFAPAVDAPSWNPGFRPHGAPAAVVRAAA